MTDLIDIKHEVDQITDPIHSLSKQMDDCRMEMDRIYAAYQSNELAEIDFRAQGKLLLEKANDLKQHGHQRSEQLHDQWLKLTCDIATHTRTGEYKTKYASRHAENSEKNAPDIFAKFYPRRYNNIGGYYSPKLVAGALTDMCLALHDIGIEKVGTAVNILLPAMDYMVDRKMPMFFLAPELLDAVKRSDFQDEIDWTTLKLPFEHGCFVLPIGGLTHHTDGDCVCVFWSRVNKGSFPIKTANIPYIIDIGKNSFGIVAWTMHGIYYDSNLTDDIRPTVKLHNLFYKYENGEPMPSRVNGPLDELLGPQDESFIEDLGVIVFGTFLAMNARPGLVTSAKHVKTISTKTTSKVEYWTPNIIGHNYRSQRQSISPGSHVSPRMHWRRGHFRNHAFGVSKSERKIIWLEPMLVAAPKDNNDSK